MNRMKKLFVAALVVLGIAGCATSKDTSKDNSSDRGLSDNDHKSVVPFYAENNGKIVFKGGKPTTIEMYDGVVIFGEDSDYTTTIGGTNKYQGMSNVKVKLMKDGINLGVFKGLNVTWAGNSNLTTYTNTLKTIPKFADLDPNGKSFKSTLTEGTLTIDSNVNLSDANDGYNNISMERELVTINAGKTVTGNGKGLSMGSNAGAANNLESGYINKGTVDITGGTSSSGVAGINVSYGQILNDTTGVVKVDNGVGLYGTNGSKIENKGTVTVTGSGTGIAGLGKGNATPAITYGDGKVEISKSNSLLTNEYLTINRKDGYTISFVGDVVDRTNQKACHRPHLRKDKYFPIRPITAYCPAYVKWL